MMRMMEWAGPEAGGGRGLSADGLLDRSLMTNSKRVHRGAMLLLLLPLL